MEPSAADSFMKEVRSNFLLCKLCDKEYTLPKTLPCMHTFCQDCLTSYAGESKQTYRYSTYCKPLSCPVCQKRTDITKDDINALPDNFLISSLSGLIRYKSEEMASCQICSRRPKGRKPTAVKRCLECGKQLCKRCVTQHRETKVTQDHTLVSLDNAHALMCTEHSEEGIRYICKSCSKCVCVFCTHTTHKGHDIMSVVEGVETCQQEVDDTIKNCNRRVDNITNQLHFIQTWELCYNQTKELILSTAAGFQTQVENQRESTLAKLDELYGTEVLDMINKKSHLTESLQGLTAACKLQSIPTASDTLSLETILMQNEIQNKVKHLLASSPTIPQDQMPSPEVSVSFERGGLSLGALVATQEGQEDPCYYDADEAEDVFTENRSWCRRCRSRSRSRSRGTDMSHKLRSSLTPFLSDTDVSLTDVSALGTMSPLFSKQNFSSLMSDMDELSIGVTEAGVQTNEQYSPNGAEYVDLATEAMTSTVPDVIPSAKQTVDSACQYELTTSCPRCLGELILNKIASQTAVDTTESSTQHISEVMDSTCQSDEVEPKVNPTSSTDVASQYNPDMVHLSTQYNPETKTSQTMTSLTFLVNQGALQVGEDADSKTRVCLSPLLETNNSTTMTNLLTTAEQSTSTSSAESKDQTTSTVSAQFVDVASNPILWPVANQESQTSVQASCEASTNTSSSTDTKHVETNTINSPKVERCSQTLTNKQKSRGVSARPSMAEFGVNVKPSDTNAYTNTTATSVNENGTQTAMVAPSHKSTSTVVPTFASRGVTAQVPGVHNQTSTADLLQSHASATQTETTNSIDVGCEAIASITDSTTNTDLVTHDTIACGSDVSNIHTSSVAVGTVPLPALRHVGISATRTTSDSWTNPVVQSTASKACGTERVKHRNVGLYVRPLSVNSSSMTTAVPKVDRGCGGDEPRLQSNKTSDTRGLIRHSHRQTNTESEVKCEMRTKHSQTRVVTLSDNYTVMLPNVLIDKSTNTPHQIPRQVLDQFNNMAAEQNCRAIQTEWIGYECPTCFPAVDGEPGSMQTLPGGNSSMQKANQIPILSVSVAEIEGSSRTQPQSNSATPYSNFNSPHQRPHLSTNSVQLTPITCDKSTNTASLSTLLHPERSSSDCVDNKISECIVKLRQVTKKLQKGSNDVARSEHSALSSNLTLPQKEAGTYVTSAPMSEVAPLIRSDSATIRRLAATWKQQSAVAHVSPSFTDAVDSRTVSNLETGARRKVHRFSRSRSRELSAQYSGEFIPSEQENFAAYDASHAGKDTLHPPSPGGGRSGSGAQWDLKALVQEEDRIKEMKRSTEHLNSLAQNRSRRESCSSVESQSIFSARSSLFGSTESLPHSASNKDTRTTTREHCSTHPQYPGVISAARDYSPIAKHELLETSASSPTRGRVRSASKSKTKARTQQLQPMAMLGNNDPHETESAQSSTKAKSINSRPSRVESKRAKSLTSSGISAITSSGSKTSRESQRRLYTKGASADHMASQRMSSSQPTTRSNQSHKLLLTPSLVLESGSRRRIQPTSSVISTVAHTSKSDITQQVTQSTNDTTQGKKKRHTRQSTDGKIANGSKSVDSQRKTKKPVRKDWS